MLTPALGFGGAFTAPHRAAALAGRDVLVAGGTAIEAMVAAAAVIAVAYPHMNGIGGDGFWLVHRSGRPPVGLSGCGRAAALATPDWYAARGHRHAIPARGALAALTCPAPGQRRCGLCPRSAACRSPTSSRPPSRSPRTASR